MALVGEGIFSECLGIIRSIRSPDHCNYFQAKVPTKLSTVETIRDMHFQIADITRLTYRQVLSGLSVAGY